MGHEKSPLFGKMHKKVRIRMLATRVLPLRSAVGQSLSLVFHTCFPTIAGKTVESADGQGEEDDKISSHRKTIFGG